MNLTEAYNAPTALLIQANIMAKAYKRMDRRQALLDAHARACRGK